MSYYAQVDFENEFQKNRGWSNRRGYGTMVIAKYDGNKIYKDIHLQNRIQPLTTPFGNHLPPMVENQQLNPQTNIAWNN
jgi:hypothetical protein